MRSSQPLLLLLALFALEGCAGKEPTVVEFVTEFNAAAKEYERVSAAMNEQPMPVLTGNRATDLQNVSTMLKTDAASFDAVIERFKNMKAPSDPPEADQLRVKFLEVIVFMRDDMLQQAKSLDAGQRPATSTSFEKTIVVKMREIADLADKIGMDSSDFRMSADKIEADFVE